MSELTQDGRNSRRDWRPVHPVPLSPLNRWPPQPLAVLRWMFARRGYLWPYNAFWFAVAIMTWILLTPNLATMQTLQFDWVAWIFARNVMLVGLLFGGLHAYFYMFRRQGDELRFSTREFTRNHRRFWFKRQVLDNVLRTLLVGVPVCTGYEVATYWLFANGYTLPAYLGWDGNAIAEATPLFFWAWFVVLALLGQFIHAVHFYLGHRLLHNRFLYKHVHALHHRNVEIGPWSGLAMHPVEHIIYFSTVVVLWVFALHPINALFQLQLALFNPAMAHCGYERIKSLDIEGGSYFHNLHHQHFECNYGGSVAPLDQWFGTFHDGTPEADAALRQRLVARRARYG